MKPGFRQHGNKTGLFLIRVWGSKIDPPGNPLLLPFRFYWSPGMSHTTSNWAASSKCRIRNGIGNGLDNGRRNVIGTRISNGIGNGTGNKIVPWIGTGIRNGPKITKGPKTLQKHFKNRPMIIQ